MLWFLITSAIGVIKTQSNIEDGAFCENGLQLKDFHYVHKKLHLKFLTVLQIHLRVFKYFSNAVSIFQQ